MYEQEEQFQQLKSSLEHEIYSKEQHINKCEELIDTLHAASSQEAIHMQLHQQQQQQQMILNEYEAQISELKLKLTNREHEVKKVGDMYKEVCNDKNNLHDTLNAEYEKKLKQQLEACLVNKLDEQKSYLADKWGQERAAIMDECRRKLEASVGEVKSLREQLIDANKQCEQLKSEKASLQVRATQIETALNEKCLNLERTAAQSEQTVETVRKDFAEQKDRLERLLSESEERAGDLKRAYEAEKQTLADLVEKSGREQESMLKINQELTQKMELESNVVAKLESRLG